MLHITSTLVLLLIVGGVYFRRQIRTHLRFMLAAFIIDLSLVVYIEATRHAVDKVVHHTGWLLWFHVLVPWPWWWRTWPRSSWGGASCRGLSPAAPFTCAWA